MNEFHSINDLISTKLLQPIVQGITTKKYVEEDERESGVRAFLNLGHTLGHAIEKESGYGKITHGEAVIIGIIYALRLSEAIFKQPFSLSIDDFISWLQQLGYRTDLPQELTIDQLIQTMKHDKKTISGTLRFVLLQKEGQPILYEVDEEVISGHLHKVFRK